MYTFQGVQEICQMYMGNLFGNHMHSLVVYKLRTPSILVVCAGVRETAYYRQQSQVV